MAPFDKIIVFRQTGVEDWQLNYLLDTVVEFLEMCDLRDKIAIQFVNQTITLEKYRVTDENDGWKNYLNGFDIIYAFGRFVPRYFYEFASILLVKDRFFSVEKERFAANGLALLQSSVMVVHGSDSKYNLRISTLHELGHIFKTQPEERTEQVMFFGVTKHCANKDCGMYGDEISLEDPSNSRFFCAVCQRYLKLFLEKNFSATSVAEKETP